MNKTLQQASLALLCSTTVALTGCPDESPASNNPSPDMDSGAADMPDMSPSGDMDKVVDMPDAEKDLPDTCVPQTMCAQGTCGMQPDGCGSQLDCGACACVDGVPQDPTCGLCGFGQASCEMATGNGSATCSLDVDTLTHAPLDCNAVVYVRQSNPSALPDGSKDNPFVELADALDAVNNQGAGFIALAQGDYTLSKALTLSEGVHMVGGFTDDFLYNEEGLSSITIGPTGPNQERVGVEAYNLQEKTWLKQLIFNVEGVDGGQTLYGMHVVNSPGLHLEEVQILTGELGDGSSGKNGGDGADGEPGQDASFYTLLAKRTGDMTMGGYTNGAFAGAGGLNTFCRTRANGGGGGEGAHVIVMDTGGGQADTTPVLPESGFANAAGTAPGGQGGTMAMPNGSHGQNGMAGVNGVDGVSGVASGAVARTYWKVEANGVDGTKGEDGEGGSGGGGTWWMEVRANAIDNKPGLSGGGGGAGGCGGEGGTAGQAGATGFGMLIVSSQGVVLDRVEITATDGGDGGNGGVGGQGGSGAQGGLGSQKYATLIGSSGNPVGERDHPHDAGIGGLGASGGDGGAGGAGAGGSSFGIYCDGASTVMRLGETEAKAGLPGKGGQQGSTPAQDGMAQDVVGCW